jgi:hypothetical protein
MTAALGFCPFCGTRLAIEGAQFCGSCGRSVAEPPSSPRNTGYVPRPPAIEIAGLPTAVPMSGLSAPMIQTGRPAGWPAVGSWDDVGAVGRVAALPVGLWIGLTLLISVLLSDAVRSAIEGTSGSSAFGNIGAGFAEQILSAGAGAVGALLAGLGFEVGAGGQAGALGVQTNIDISFGIGLLPLSTLAIFGVLMARGSRSAAITRGGVRIQDFVTPALLAAAGTALAMYLGSLILSSSIGGLLSSQGSGAGFNATIRGGPTITGLLFVLFPVLAAGSITGAMLGGGWPLARERLLPQLAAPSFVRVLARAPLLLYAAGGYVATLAIGSAIALVVLLFLGLVNGLDLVVALRILPAAIVLMPNAIAELVLAGTGTQIGVGTTGLASTSASQVGSLWDASLEWVVAGTVALAAPGLIAGIIARRRMPSATPGQVALVGGLTAVLALIGAVMAMPSFSGSGSVFVSESSAGTKLIFDLGHAVVVGGTLLVVSTLVGFRFGGGLAEHVPDVMVPR